MLEGNKIVTAATAVSTIPGSPTSIDFAGPQN